MLAHGVTCSLATNNVLNPFTPFGDCSLVRMANLYANIAHAGTPHELAACFELVTRQPAKLMNLKDYGVEVGNPADLVVLDNVGPGEAVAEISAPLLGIKRGRRSFVRAPPVLLTPA
jgi:cytosine deaminase